MHFKYPFISVYAPLVNHNWKFIIFTNQLQNQLLHFIFWYGLSLNCQNILNEYVIVGFHHTCALSTKHYLNPSISGSRMVIFTSTSLKDFIVSSFFCSLHFRSFPPSPPTSCPRRICRSPQLLQLHCFGNGTDWESLSTDTIWCPGACTFGPNPSKSLSARYARPPVPVPSPRPSF